MEKGTYKVSVIIPIYNVRNFISRCAESLMRQMLSDVEYIFVDDATTDDSIEILHSVLENYPENKKCVKIIHHETNKGLPAARNTGLSFASGEYIFHCDGDDYVEYNMLKDMYSVAKKENSDIVWTDWFLSFESKERYMSQPYYDTAEDALKGLLSGVMKYNVWNKLVKRSLYEDNNIEFPSGHGMGEDMTMVRLFACAKRVAYIPKAYYHYVKINSGAMTNMWTQKHINDLKYNVTATEDYIKQKFGDKMDEYIAYFKLSVKVHFLISNDIRMYKLWDSLFSEANRYIMQNNSVCLRTRVLQWMAWNKQYWFVKLYYVLIQKLIVNFLLGYK